MDRDFVASLARGLDVIRAFGTDAREMTLSQVALRAGMTRAAARRFLITLTALGYVAVDGRHFRLTPAVLSLGYAYLASIKLSDLAQPFLERISERLGESCSVSVLDGDEIVYVARMPTKRIMSVALGIGARLPATATSMGRVLLAALAPAELDAVLAGAALKRYTRHTVTSEARLRRLLSEISAQGFALVDQELEEGLRSIAVPLVNAQGRVLAAMNVSSHAARVPEARMLRSYLPPLREAAAELSAHLPV